MQAAVPLAGTRPAADSGHPASMASSLRPALLWAGLAFGLSAALFARIMSDPVRRDEQMFFSIPLLAGEGDIYRDFGFNHLPNLALLLGPLLQSADQPFLAGRAFIFAAWLVTAALMAVHARRATGSAGMAGLSVLLLLTSPLLVNQTGTSISNNFLPIPFVLGGALAFFIALDRMPPASTRGVLLVGLSGVLLSLAVGLKGNYIFAIPPFAVASLLVPAALPFTARLRRVTLPLLAGGLVGGIPTLGHLIADPQGFLAHVVGYHTGPHGAWAAQSSEELVVSVADRVMLAQGLWGSGGMVLTVLVIVTIVIARAGGGWRPGWKVWTTAALVLLAMLVSFVPTPAFPQYYSPPVAFVILLLLLMVGELPPAQRSAIRPLLLALGLMAVVVDGPRLVRDLPALADPGGWTGNDVHRLSTAVVEAAAGRPIATLAPIYALEAGGRVYPELAAGQFIYRVADIIPAGDRRHYRLVSAATLPALLDADPPGAVLVGTDGALDDAFRAYARARGYVERPLADADTRYGRLELFVPAARPGGTSASMSIPAPTLPAMASAPDSSTR